MIGDDSMEGINEFWKDCSSISKWAGGIGSHVHNIRAKGSYIRGTNGTSNGLVPLLKVVNEISNYVDQGGNKRPGSHAVYVEPWHADVFDFISLRKQRGNERERAKNLFYAMWMNDEFMRCVVEETRLSDNTKLWYLMCPDVSKGLSDVFDKKLNTQYLSDEFVAANKDDYAFTYKYREYIKQNKFVKQVSAIELWKHICEVIIETGIPYMLYKDAANRKTNQSNLGVIKSSNLCVDGSTVILTRDHGNKPIRHFVGQSPHIWNGMSWTPAEVTKTSDDEQLFLVTFNDSNVLKCTANHKFYVVDPVTQEFYSKRTNELVMNDLLIPYFLPVGNKQNQYPNITEDTWKTSDIVNKVKPSANIRVLTVKACGSAPTYCFNEPIEHKGIFNGILTGNCTEIMEYSSPDETAVCNLASICLQTLVTTEQTKSDPIGGFEGKYINWDLLEHITRILVRNLNKVIDINFYPTANTQRSNLRHRPIGLGVQGLADLYTSLRIPFDSDKAMELNFYLFEAIYFYSLDESNKIATERGYSYETFHGSPASNGILQFDMWIEENDKALKYPLFKPWTDLKERIKATGLFNSLFVAPMPTGTTSTIMGGSPCFEPHNALIYKRRNKSGEFVVINKNLQKDMIELGLWNKKLYNDILINPAGSMENIPYVPRHIRDLYKTVWDMSPKAIINQAICRGVFVDQSQSMSLFIPRPNIKLLTQIHNYCWKNGLKTSSYYTRQLGVVDAQKIQVETEERSSPVKVEMCSRDNPDCATCSS
jgi:ribonucleotide reductase alpha subunit